MSSFTFPPFLSFKIQLNQSEGTAAFSSSHCQNAFKRFLIVPKIPWKGKCDSRCPVELSAETGWRIIYSLRSDKKRAGLSLCVKKKLKIINRVKKVSIISVLDWFFIALMNWAHVWHSELHWEGNGEAPKVSNAWWGIPHAGGMSCWTSELMQLWITLREPPKSRRNSPPVLHQELNYSPFRHYCCPLYCMEGDWNHIPILLWRWVLPGSTQVWWSAYSKACVARNSLLPESSLQHSYLHKSILTAVIHTLLVQQNPFWTTGEKEVAWSGPGLVWNSKAWGLIPYSATDLTESVLDSVWVTLLCSSYYLPQASVATFYSPLHSALHNLALRIVINCFNWQDESKRERAREPPRNKWHTSLGSHSRKVMEENDMALCF